MHLACHARMESLTVGWRGPALQGFDVGGYRDRFNVFKVPVPASFTPGQKLLDRAVIAARVFALRIGTVKNSKNFSWWMRRHPGRLCFPVNLQTSRNLRLHGAHAGSSNPIG